jgi:hypothetical protein
MLKAALIESEPAAMRLGISVGQDFSRVLGGGMALGRCKTPSGPQAIPMYSLRLAVKDALVTSAFGAKASEASRQLQPGRQQFLK